MFSSKARISLSLFDQILSYFSLIPPLLSVKISPVIGDCLVDERGNLEFFTLSLFYRSVSRCPSFPDSTYQQPLLSNPGERGNRKIANAHLFTFLSMTDAAFSKLSDDVVLNIVFKLDDDPRNLARLACVCTKFYALVRNFCWKNKCSQIIPSIVSDLLSTAGSSSDPPGGWAALHKLSICCPGLLHAGVLLENSDFGLERELGPDENYQTTGIGSSCVAEPSPTSSSSSSVSATTAHPDSNWSLFDDLYSDTVYDLSETQDRHTSTEQLDGVVAKVGRDYSIFKRRRKNCRSVQTHLASGVWNLSREQGNKLLASRFRGDCLYMCDWPGCVHIEEKRKYMLFRGIFKNFKRSRVWRTINDANRSKIALDCAFCPCKETWDLHSAFCLRRVFGYHDDGEPVVRAYVCENGHVSGAWTDRPMFN